MTSPEPRLSGSVFLDQIEVLTVRFGRKAIDEALGTLSADDQLEISGLLAVSWCRADLAMRFKNALAERQGMPPLALQRYVSSAGIERTVRGVWRFLLKQMGDEALMKRVPMLYSRTFSFGQLRVEEVTPSATRFVLTGWPTIPDYDLHGLAFGMEAVLAISGRKDGRVIWKRGRSDVVFTASWR